jgi:hypothetical protein
MVRVTLAQAAFSLAVLFAVLVTGCVSPRQARDRGLARVGEGAATARVEGLVAGFDGSTLVVAGLMGKTSALIDSGTRIVIAGVATPSDLEPGTWLEIKGLAASTASPIPAAEIRISDERPLAAVETRPRTGTPEGFGRNDNRVYGGRGQRLGIPFGQTPGYRGKVENFDGNTVVISMSSFGARTLVSFGVDSATRMVKLTKGSIADISIGGQVTVVLEMTNTGAVLTREIEYVEPSDRTVESKG